MGTNRELELSAGDRALLEMLCQGKNNKEIAQVLGRAQESISRRLGRIQDKLGAVTLCQAVALYKELPNTGNR